MMRPRWVLHVSLYYVLIMMVWPTGADQEETFSSIAEMRKMVNTERYLLDGMEDYILNEEHRLAELRSIIDQRRRDLQRQPLDDTSRDEDVEHPVKAYHLISRWIKLMEKAASNSSMETLKEALHRNHVPLLTEGDAMGAAAALVRLQRVYNISMDDMAEGTVMGQMSKPLEGADMFKMGQVAMDLRDYGLAINWLTRATQTSHADYSISESLVLQAKAHHAIGNHEIALRILRRAHSRTRMNSDVQDMIKKYAKANETMYEKRDGVPQNTEDTWKRGLHGWKASYEALCRGEVLHRNPNILKKLHCRYRNTFIPYYKIKEEVLSIEPWIAIFYDVIFDEEIEEMKRLAAPSLNRAKVGDPKKSHAADTRISKVAWLWDNSGKAVVSHMSKRVEIITGLSTTYRAELSSAEPFQVVNYGMAGQYEPHHDYYKDAKRRANVPSYLLGTGDRICTFLYYLSDVKAGGATVFPKINVYVPPIKGAAAFWFNIKKNGDMDSRTQHAGCPVLMGEKWVANKWIRELGQEFRRKCGLTYHSPEDGY